jgi:hypothetical protein
MREVSAQNSFNGHSEFTLHVGLGAATTVDQLRIVWPRGLVEQLENVAANTVLTLVEGQTTAVGAEGPRVADLSLRVLGSLVTDAMMSVEMSLPTSAPARIELFDTRGRRLANRDLGVLGAGRQRIELESPRSSGIYWLRLHSNQGSVVTRAVVLR